MKLHRLLPLLLLALMTLTAPAFAASWQGEFHLTAYDSEGKEIWSEVAPNSLADEGEQMLLDVALRGGTAPTQYFLRLFNDTPIETDTLAALTGQPSTNGYAAQLVERSAVGWPTLALDSGDFQAVSKEVTFTASGGSWGPVSHCVLATSSDNTGKLISFAALSQARTLAAGETLRITYRVKLQ